MLLINILWLNSCILDVHFCDEGKREEMDRGRCRLNLKDQPLYAARVYVLVAGAQPPEGSLGYGLSLQWLMSIQM